MRVDGVVLTMFVVTDLLVSGCLGADCGCESGARWVVPGFNTSILSPDYPATYSCNRLNCSWTLASTDGSYSLYKPPIRIRRHTTVSS